MNPGYNTKTIILTLWVMAIGILSLPAQSPEGLEWEYFGPEQGMGMGFLDIMQDHQGFIWLGATNGLYRYDGYQIKSFKKYSNKPSGLSSDFIWDLEEDREGNIWIATYDGGVNKWSRSSGRFSHFLPEPGNANGIRGKNVLKVLADTGGLLWIVVRDPGGVPVLDRLDPATGKVTHFNFSPDNPRSLSCDTLTITGLQHMQLPPLYLDPSGQVWVATENGLNLYLGEGKGFRRFRHEENNPNSLSYRKVIAIEASKKEEGVYWVRTASPGLKKAALDKLNVRTNTVERISFDNGTGGNSCLGFYINEDKGEIWISDRSVFQYQTTPPYYEQRQAVLEPANGQLAPRLALYAHSSGNLFFLPEAMNPLDMIRGGEILKTSNGLYYLSPEKGKPIFFSQNPTNETLPFKGVNAVFEDRSGILWIGCLGFYKLKITGEKTSYQPVFETYPQTTDGTDGLRSTDIRDICEESPAIFWLATYDGLSRLDRKSRKVLNFVNSPANPNSIGGKHIFALWRDPQTNKLWIGHEKGIDILHLDTFDPAEPSSIIFHHLKPAPSRLWEEGVNEIQPDGKGNLWIGTPNHGLLLFDPDKEEALQQIIFSQPNPDPVHSSFINVVFTDSKGQTWVAPGMGGLCRLRPAGGSFEYDCFLEGLFIVDFFEASDGLLWCAAMNYGLVKFNPADNSYELINMENRLARNSVLGIEEDKLGRIWFTSIGLSRYDPQNDTYKTYGREAGLIGLDPERFFFKSSSGEMFYSALHSALQIFTPERVEDNPITPGAVLTDFKLFNESQIAGEDSPLKENIEVASEIRLAHYQHSFSFEFAGLEYTNSKENQYRYQLVGLDKGWVYSGAYREARYNSVRPGKYLFQVQAANSDGVWSEEPATVQVIIDPPWWSRWWAYIFFTAFFLAPVFLIYRYQVKRKVALAEARRLKEVDQLKTRLYTNITHEFRTPLTVILGMAEQMGRQPERWFREGLSMIIRNAQSLLTLVNQMLDLRKIESGVMPVEKKRGDVINYLRYVSESFHSFAASKRIGLDFLSQLEELYMDYDEDKLLKILSNLLSNAIKYTPEEGNVYVLADCKKEDSNELLELRVKDTGIGIPSDKQARVFDRFYQVDDSATRHGEGAGVGLALTQELVKLLGGAISVRSEPGKGSEFLVQLPVTRTAPLRGSFGEERAARFAGQFAVADSAPSASPEELPLPGDRNDKPIALVIEDNKDVVRYLRACLEEEYFLLAAYDGKAGVDIAVREVPDVIISDVMMPQMDGFEVTDTLKNDERTSHIPVILLTARATMEDRIAGLKRGADAYLAKPFNREELMVHMEKMIELRRRLQERYAGLNPAPALPGQPLEIEDAFVQKVRELVEAHLDDPDFSIDEVSKAIFLSRTQVHRKLKALTGLPTGHYIRSIRLHHARHLLRSTSKSVTEIAYEVGFQDLSYFSKMFTAEFGKSPSESRG